jgi:O-antigen/teichoic acid export membrane protein
LIRKDILKSGLVKDSVTYYTSKIIPGLIGILIIPGILKLYGESVYGEYSLSISIVQTVSTFFSGWLGRTFMRFYTSQKDSGYFSGVYSRLLYLLLIPVVLICAAMLYAIKYSHTTVVIAVTCSVVFTVYSFNSLKFQTLLKSRSILYCEVIRSISFFSLVFILFFLFKDISEHKINLILLSSLISFAAGNILFKVLDREGKPKTGRETSLLNIDSSMKSQLINYGLPLALWMIGAFALNISDRYVLKIYYDFETVGTYSSVYDTINKLITFLFTPLIVSIQPRLIKHFNEGNLKRARQIMIKSLYLELLLLLALLIFFIVFKRQIIFNYLGIKSSEALSLVYPILFGSFTWNLSMLIQKPLELGQRTKLMLWGVLAALSLNLILNFIFIPQYGMMAAAYTTLVSSIFYLIFSGLISVRISRQTHLSGYNENEILL